MVAGCGTRSAIHTLCRLNYGAKLSSGHRWQQKATNCVFVIKRLVLSNGLASVWHWIVIANTRDSMLGRASKWKHSRLSCVWQLSGGRATAAPTSSLIATTGLSSSVDRAECRGVDNAVWHGAGMQGKRACAQQASCSLRGATDPPTDPPTDPRACRRAPAPRCCCR
jgi:hypothetical protein